DYLQVSPNPFRNNTKMRYSILDTGYLMQNPTVSIYDASGRLVSSFDLVSSIENQESEVIWDGTDQTNHRLPGGVYFLRLEAGDYTETKKIVLLR
ncbi:MAG: T9SS type A sorting domain-containing protein, partial [bacterium]